MNASQWSVWLANLDPVVGSEPGRTRPVLVISDTSLNNILPVVNVIPITSMKPNRRVYPNEALLPANTGGLALDSLRSAIKLELSISAGSLRSLGSLRTKNSGNRSSMPYVFSWVCRADENVVNPMTECQKLAHRYNEDEAVWARYVERRRVRNLLGVQSLLGEDILEWLDWLEAERECQEFHCVA